MTTEFETFANTWANRAWNGSLDEGKQALYDLLAADCLLEGLGGDMPPLNGPAAYEPAWRQLREAFPDLRCSITETLPSGDGRSGTFRFRMTGTHRGSFIGKAATGKPIDVHGMAMVWLGADGKAIKVHNAWDVIALFVQIDHAVDSVKAAIEAHLPQVN